MSLKYQPSLEQAKAAKGEADEAGALLSGEKMAAQQVATRTRKPLNPNLNLKPQPKP